MADAVGQTVHTTASDDNVDAQRRPLVLIIGGLGASIEFLSDVQFYPFNVHPFALLLCLCANTCGLVTQATLAVFLPSTCTRTSLPLRYGLSIRCCRSWHGWHQNSMSHVRKINLCRLMPRGNVSDISTYPNGISVSRWIEQRVSRVFSIEQMAGRGTMSLIAVERRGTRRMTKCTNCARCSFR
jgi:hypothetical protein